MVSQIYNTNNYLLPQVVDEAASNYPDKLWMTVPRSEKLDQGWRDLTFRDLSRAVNNLAHWIEKTIGISNSRETLAYMRYDQHTRSDVTRITTNMRYSENDAGYPIFLVAAIKLGYKVSWFY